MKHQSPVTSHQSLSVVLATRNEEANIEACLDSVKNIADEIIVVDEDSSDKTREIAKKFGAKVYKVKHEPIFHKTKEKALDYATGDWILQLDADERVTQKLSDEIKKVINVDNKELLSRTVRHLIITKREAPSFAYHKSPSAKRQALLITNHINLFIRHQKLIEQRDGLIGKQTGKVVAFFIPRRNYFLGKPLIHAGVYPDGQIRLVKKDKARFPSKSVHEQMEIDGEVAWLFNDLLHDDSPTLKRYLERMNRYTELHANDLKNKKMPKNLLYLSLYTIYKPLYTFLNLFVRHKGFLDGIRGFLWSFFSAMHYPITYFKYWQKESK